MEYKELGASPPLSSYIQRFWSLEFDAAHTAGPEIVLPDGCPEIVFNLSDRFRRLDQHKDELQPLALFAGQMIRRVLIHPTGRVRLFGVRFHPAGAYPLFDFPMDELSNQIVDLTSCIGRSGTRLEEKVNDAPTFEARIEIFEAYFLKRLGAMRNVNVAASHAVRTIVGCGGRIPVSGLAKRIGISERTLERSFRTCVGISPKMLARIVRFQKLIKLIQNSETPGMLDASLATGYFDQSHAIREFREFSGATPLAYFEITHGLSDVFTGKRE